MKPEAQIELLHGPYAAPNVQVGQELECMVRGTLTVRRFSQGLLAWPMGHPGGQDGGRHSYIVCGDLVRAIRCESSQAVQHWWGVSIGVVTRWRAALGVEANPEGTRRLRSRQAAGSYPAERLAGLWAKTLRRQQQKQEQSAPLSWPAEEEALLGTMPDALVGEKLGRAASVVRTYRKMKGIIPYCRGQSATQMHPCGSMQLWSGRMLLSSEKLQARRALAGFASAQVARQAGLSRERYRNYEKFATRQVEPEVVARLAEVLACSPDDLLAGL